MEVTFIDMTMTVVFADIVVAVVVIVEPTVVVFNVATVVLAVALFVLLTVAFALDVSTGAMTTGMDGVAFEVSDATGGITIIGGTSNIGGGASEIEEVNY